MEIGRKSSASETVLPGISIILPTYNREEILIQVIEALLKQDYQNFELLIINQTTTPQPNLDTFLKLTNDSRVRHFHIAPPSLPMARNFGVSKARSEIILFVDDDTIPTAGFISAHEREYADTAIAGVGGRVIFGEVEPPSESLLKILLGGDVTGGFNFAHEQDTVFLCGGNMSFRSAVIKSLRGFDSRFEGNAMREDSDFCLAAVKRGYRLVYRPGPVVHHVQATTGGCRVHGSLYDSHLYIQNETLFFLKHWNKFLFGYFIWKQFRKGFRDRRITNPFFLVKRSLVIVKGVLGGGWAYAFRSPKLTVSTLPDNRFDGG